MPYDTDPYGINETEQEADESTTETNTITRPDGTTVTNVCQRTSPGNRDDWPSGNWDGDTQPTHPTMMPVDTPVGADAVADDLSGREIGGVEIDEDGTVNDDAIDY